MTCKVSINSAYSLYSSRKMLDFASASMQFGRSASACLIASLVVMPFPHFPVTALIHALTYSPHAFCVAGPKELSKSSS